jgi:hypothetical protein
LGSERPSFAASDWLRELVPPFNFHLAKVTNIERIDDSIEDWPHLTVLIEMSIGSA